MNTWQITQQLLIACKDLALAQNEFINPLQLCTAYRRLDVRHFVFESHYVRPKLLGLSSSATMIAQR